MEIKGDGTNRARKLGGEEVRRRGGKGAGEQGSEETKGARRQGGKGARGRGSEEVRRQGGTEAMGQEGEWARKRGGRTRGSKEARR